jgi:hypothetical protein
MLSTRRPPLVHDLDRGRTRGGRHPPHEHAHPARLPTPASRVSDHTRANPATNTQVSAIRVYKITRSLQLRPYVQHSDVFGSPSQGPLEASAVAAIARLPDVGAAAGGLVLTEIKTTIPADNMPPPSSFQPPVQVSVTGVDLGHPGLGPLATARLVSSRAFAPDLYIPMARAQALAKLGGQVNIVYVRAASAAAVGAVTGEISRLLPSA